MRFKPVGAVFNAGGIVLTVAVARKANDVGKSGVGHNGNQFFVGLHERIVMFGAIPRFGNATQSVFAGVIDHCANQTVIFQSGKRIGR